MVMAASVHRVQISKTHPSLYRALMTLSIMYLALGVNFWYSNPTFNPYGINKDIIGVIFFWLGASLIVFLNILRDLRMVRIALAISISFMFFWGCSNAEQSFAGQASFQLPILYVAFSFLQIPLLTESPVNPMTEKK